MIEALEQYSSKCIILFVGHETLRALTNPKQSPCQKKSCHVRAHSRHSKDITCNHQKGSYYRQHFPQQKILFFLAWNI
jgi:hypothetical protein